jgi:glycosyltransferase involved in cell wall biosynthesis
VSGDPGARHDLRRVRAVAVVVPARDEEELLPRCLDALEAARSELLGRHPRLPCRVFVALDSCHDASAEVVASRPDVTAVPVSFGQVGATRAAGVRAAGQWARQDAAAVWVASTDADTVVPPDWLSAQVALAEAGADLVVGTVQPDPGDLGAAEWERWWARHTMPDGHEHVHGANLGFTLAAHDRVGGFPHLPLHEDVELVRRIREAGLTCVAPGALRVTTSGRRSNRAPGGFAAYLDDLGA